MAEVLLELSHHDGELSAIDQLQRLPFGELQRFVGVDTAGDEDGAVGPLGGHDAEQFTNRLDADLVGLPAFALDDGFLAVPMQDQVDAAIASASTGFFHVEALLPVDLGDLMFKCLPAQLVEPTDVDVFCQEGLLALPHLPCLETSRQADQSEDAAKNHTEQSCDAVQ